MSRVNGTLGFLTVSRILIFLSICCDILAFCLWRIASLNCGVDTSCWIMTGMIICMLFIHAAIFVTGYAIIKTIEKRGG